MVGIYKIINEDTGNEIPFNETALLRIIKYVDGRSKPLYEYYVNIWENLEGKIFDKSQLEFI